MIVALSIELMEHYSNIAIKIIFNLQKAWPVLPVSSAIIQFVFHKA